MKQNARTIDPAVRAKYIRNLIMAWSILAVCVTGSSVFGHRFVKNYRIHQTERITRAIEQMEAEARIREGEEKESPAAEFKQQGSSLADGDEVMADDQVMKGDEVMGDEKSYAGAKVGPGQFIIGIGTFLFILLFPIATIIHIGMSRFTFYGWRVFWIAAAISMLTIGSTAYWVIGRGHRIRK